MADISVIIPAFNSANCIQAALRSVAQQTLKPNQVIVVDDGSSDDTYSLALSMHDHMTGIQLVVIKQPNLGAGAARNRAMSKATSSWLAFLDADDVWLPNKLEHSMEVIQTGTFDLVAHDYIAIHNDNETTINCASLFQQYADPFIGLYRKGFIATSSVVVRKELVFQAGGFDETLKTAQDFDLWLKILARPHVQFNIFDEALMRYAIVEGSITRFTQRRLACSLVILNRHGPALLKRTGGIINVYYRILAVHYEAITVNYAHQRYGLLIRNVLMLPFRLLAATHFLWHKEC